MAVATEGHILLGLQPEDAPGTELLRLVAGFRRECPRIRCTVTFGPLSVIQEELIAERLSFAVVDRPSDHDFIETVTYGERRDVLVAAKRYVDERGPFATSQSLALADLVVTKGKAGWAALVQPFAGGLAGSGTGDDCAGNDGTAPGRGERARGDTGSSLGEVAAAVVVPCDAAALELARAGSGIALLPDALAQASLVSGELVELKPTGFHPPKRPQVLLYRKRSARQLYESLFLEYFLEAVGGESPPPAQGLGRRRAS